MKMCVTNNNKLKIHSMGMATFKKWKQYVSIQFNLIICFRKILALETFKGEWHGILVFITACHSKGLQFKSCSGHLLVLFFVFINNCVCWKNKKIHPYGMTNFTEKKIFLWCLSRHLWMKALVKLAFIVTKGVHIILKLVWRYILKSTFVWKSYLGDQKSVTVKISKIRHWGNE